MRDYFPAAVIAYKPLTLIGPDALELLAKAPDPASAARLSLTQISAALKRSVRIEKLTGSLPMYLRRSSTWSCRSMGKSASLDRAELGADELRPSRTYSASVTYATDHERLTRRELQIADLVATGLTNQEIAEHLHVTVDTVKKHISNVLRKTRCTSRTRFAVLWR